MRKFNFRAFLIENEQEEAELLKSAKEGDQVSFMAYLDKLEERNTPYKTRWIIRADYPEVAKIESIDEEDQLDSWGEQRIAEFLRRRNAIGRVVERGDLILGFVLYTLEHGATHIEKMVIHPWARRRGAGKELIDELKESLARRDERRDPILRASRGPMQLTVRSPKKAAGFFDRQGFKGVGSSYSFHH